ncbi:MAG: type II toxin-antitoxin system RelE/ParE family toxin [Thermoanaerobaculia bacterium]
MKIVWTPLAIERASEEAAFIASDKPDAAKRWLEQLFAAVDRLMSFPASGKRLPELPASEYRQLVFKSHRVVYRVAGDVVAVLTVRRFKQRLPVDELT